MKCPHCGQQIKDDYLLEHINPAKIRSLAASLAGKAGKGRVKARSPEQASAAARARWAKKRELRNK